MCKRAVPKTIFRDRFCTPSAQAAAHRTPFQKGSQAASLSETFRRRTQEEHKLPQQTEFSKTTALGADLHLSDPEQHCLTSSRTIFIMSQLPCGKKWHLLDKAKKWLYDLIVYISRYASMMTSDRLPFVTSR